MKKSKGQTVDLLYKSKEKPKKQNKKTKNKKQKSDNEVINLDNEIIIGMTLKEEPKKTKKKKEQPKTKIKKTKKNTNKVQKTKKRPKTKKKNMKLKIIKWIFLLALLATAIILFLLSSVFNITDIVVENNKKISEQEIVNLSGLVKNENMFKTTNKKIKEGIKQNPYIEDVVITRELSGKVKLKVIERTPTYMIKFANGYAYINNQGYILEISEEALHLPIITGFKTSSEEIKAGNRLVVDDLKELENVIKIMETAKNTSIADIITEIDISNSNNYKLVIASEGKTVQFGDLNNINVKILKIEYILEQEKGREGEIYFQNTEKAVFREKV